MLDRELDALDPALSLRAALALIQSNEQKLLGLQEEVQNLGSKHGQLWTGVNVVGDEAHPGTGAERNSIRWRSEIGLGNKAGNYTDWTPVVVASGYTVWRITPTQYQHNDFNSVYLDGQPLGNRGEAASLALASWLKVLLYDGATFTDHTTEASSQFGADFALLADTDDYLYVGASAVFEGVAFSFHTPGSGNTITVQYWDGAAWQDIDQDGDTTDNWVQDGAITWTGPSSWAQTVVDGTNAYWVRFKTGAIPSRVARAFYIAPTTSVISLLQLNRENLQKGEFAFCSLGNDLYVALPSDGDPVYEGSTFIRTGSSTTNLLNYFAANHELIGFYEDSLWTGGDISVYPRRIASANEPVPYVDEKLWWFDNVNIKVWEMYGDPVLGPVKVELT